MLREVVDRWPDSNIELKQAETFFKMAKVFNLIHPLLCKCNLMSDVWCQQSVSAPCLPALLDGFQGSAFTCLWWVAWPPVMGTRAPTWSDKCGTNI